MATLISPGTSITVIDESMNIGAGPGTVPVIFIVTGENKPDPSGTHIAPGTLKANANKVYSITSQRDLVQTFGDPYFYEVSGTSINGYPLNEYGLLAAYSFLGISNLARVVRADLDLAQLEATPVEPTSPAAPGTYWFDETPSPTGSSYGLFVRVGTGIGASWTAVRPEHIFNFTSGTTNTPTGGSEGQHAIVFQTAISTMSYWVKRGGVWLQLGTNPTDSVVISDVWPDLNISTAQYWIKTTSPAQGINLVLRRMDFTLGQFIQIEAPIQSNDSNADIYYSTMSAGSAGQVYIKPVTTGTGATTPNSFEFRHCSGDTLPYVWAPLAPITGAKSVPRGGPLNGQLWYNSLIGVNNSGQSTIDILIADGTGNWQNINLPGFGVLPVMPGQPTLYSQSQDPNDNYPKPFLSYGDIWVDTDKPNYPAISRWNGVQWVAVDLSDQTTPNGIIFSDARPHPMYHMGNYTGQNNGGGNAPDLDPDAPDADRYPRGFLLWNTRYSTNNVKEWVGPYFYRGIAAEPDDTNGDSTGRWVNKSGNDASGRPYMGTGAQKVVAVEALQETILTVEDLRAEDLYFNLMACPGFTETIDDMLVLNTARKETAFVIGDSPFTLRHNGIDLQAWSTNSNGALGDGDVGLVTQSKYCAVWYPSGLSTNTDGTAVVVPPSHMMLRTMAYNDQVSYPWFAPAGLQRGIVGNATSVGFVNDEGRFVSVKLSEGQRDILYQNSVNPIRIMPQGSIVVYGQKTRQAYQSSTDRINVVRLENYLRYQLDVLAQPFLFEPNDKATRKAVKTAFDKFMSELVTLRAIYDFLVVCDESNNLPARIDRHELWIDVAIQPAQAIEFIYIPVRIVNTGASMTNG